MSILYHIMVRFLGHCFQHNKLPEFSPTLSSKYSEVYILISFLSCALGNNFEESKSLEPTIWVAYHPILEEVVDWSISGLGVVIFLHNRITLNQTKCKILSAVNMSVQVI